MHRRSAPSGLRSPSQPQFAATSCGHAPASPSHGHAPGLPDPLDMLILTALHLGICPLVSHPGGDAHSYPLSRWDMLICRRCRRTSRRSVSSCPAKEDMSNRREAAPALRHEHVQAGHDWRASPFDKGATLPAQQGQTDEGLGTSVSCVRLQIA